MRGERQARRTAADDEHVDLLGQSVGIGQHVGIRVGFEEVGITRPVLVEIELHLALSSLSAWPICRAFLGGLMMDSILMISILSI